MQHEALMDYDHDEDLERALALSLQEPTPEQRRNATANNPDSDAEDPAFQEELKRAIEESKAHGQARVAPSSSTATSTGFISERAKLEQERLARQKRLRQGAGLGDLNADASDLNEERPTKRRNAASSRSTVSPATANGVGIFLNGELRQTACQSSEPRKDGRPTFRLTEILGDNKDICFAVLSSYSLDLAWIYQFFDPVTPVIMVGQAGQDGQEILRYTFPTWVMSCPALRGGRGCMHMKFMLLFYKTGRLRLVISTANLIAFDWQLIENMVWVQDVYPITGGPPEKSGDDSFGAVFVRVLDAVGAGKALDIIRRDHPNLPIQSTKDLHTKYDYSKVRAQLVPSIAGRQEGWPSVLLSGHPRLMKAVRSIDGWRRQGGKKGKELQLEYQGSSIGQYTTQWLNEFYCSAKGDSAADWLDVPKARRLKLPYPPIHIVFPSKTTVATSRLGEPGGGTIFCSKRQWDAPNFPRDKFRDSKSTGGPSLMHSKMIVATFREETTDVNSDTDTDTDDDGIEIVEDAGWIYVGSHNFTPSAWGNLSGHAVNPVLNTVNFELGIVLPFKSEGDLNKVACFQRPPPRYKKGERPWIQEESAVMQG